jgi:hypothetical protein
MLQGTMLIELVIFPKLFMHHPNGMPDDFVFKRPLLPILSIWTSLVVYFWTFNDEFFWRNFVV